MSVKHHHDDNPAENKLPTHPVKSDHEMTEGKLRDENEKANNQSTKDHMVDIGRGENTRGRQGQ